MFTTSCTRCGHGCRCRRGDDPAGFILGFIASVSFWCTIAILVLGFRAIRWVIRTGWAAYQRRQARTRNHPALHAPHPNGMMPHQGVHGGPYPVPQQQMPYPVPAPQQMPYPVPAQTITHPLPVSPTRPDMGHSRSA